VSNEIAVDVKLIWIPVAVKRSGIDGTSPTNKQLSTKTDPLSNLVPSRSVLTKQHALITLIVASLLVMIAPMELSTNSHCLKHTSPANWPTQPNAPLQFAMRTKLPFVVPLDGRPPSR
jgi:hypothetical protein